MPLVKVDVNQDAIEDLIDQIKSGFKGVLKMTVDNVKRTVQKGGSLELPLNQTQVERIRKAAQKGTGVRIIMTDAQTRKVASGGFLPALGALAPALLGAAKIAGPILGKAGLGAAAGFGVNSILKKIFGKGLQPVSLGNGLYLAPYQSGSGMDGEDCDCVMSLRYKDQEIPLQGGFLGSILKKLGSIIPF